jgi:hypothetical protein
MIITILMTLLIGCGGKDADTAEETSQQEEQTDDTLVGELEEDTGEESEEEDSGEELEEEDTSSETEGEE